MALPCGFSRSALSAGRGTDTDTDLYQRIEILHGSAASMYDSDGVTGVLNFVSKDAQDFLDVFGKQRYFVWRPSYDSSDASYGCSITTAFGNERLINASVASLQMTASGTGWTTCVGTQYCEYAPKNQYRVMGAYLQDDIRLSKFSVVLGLRRSSPCKWRTNTPYLP